MGEFSGIYTPNINIFKNNAIIMAEKGGTEINTSDLANELGFYRIL